MIRRLIALAAAVVAGFSCTDQGAPPVQSDPDAALYRYITLDDPFAGWQVFPRADSIAEGTLNGSQAHRPLVQVRINAAAAHALVSDTLPAGRTFPDGSTIVKTILTESRVTLLAVMRKDAANPLAGGGWLWAEFEPGGRPFISAAARGAGCTGCHAREQGTMHDHVRTFERQR